MKDMIQIKYTIEKNFGYFGFIKKESRIFGDKFLENNKRHCKIIINEEELELTSFYKHDNKNREEEDKLDINRRFNEELLNKIVGCKFELTIKLKGIKNIVDISHMFDSCEEIIDLKISKFDTSNIINMNSLFHSCQKLRKVPDISKWNVNNVTNMSGLFVGCSSLISLPDISQWNVNNVTNMSHLFSGCKSLKTLSDISKWNVNNVINMSGLFSGCKSLIFLPEISQWNVNNVSNMNQLFNGCSSLLSLPDISQWNVNNLSNMSCLFSRCSSLISLPDISKWNVNNVTNMSYLFSGCKSLISLPDISKWYINNVTNMSYLFYELSSLIFLPDISQWNINNVTDMSYLFSGCKSLISLPDISQWYNNNVINISGLFVGCSSLISLPDISQWNVNNLFFISSLFDGCSSLLKKYINKPKILKENHKTNTNILLEPILKKNFFLNGNQKEEKLEKNLNEFEKNNIMDCENNSFDYFKELRNKTSYIRDFDNNFENYNSETINLGIETDNTYFSFKLNMTENIKSNKDSIGNLNSEIDKNEINNCEFLYTTIKQEKDNCIYNRDFSEIHKLLIKELIKEMIGNKNFMNYINLEKNKKQNLKIINNLNDFKQFYHKSKEFETLSLNTNIPNIKAYNLFYYNFYRNYIIGFLKKKYIKEKKPLFFQKKILFKIFNYFLEIIKKIERLKLFI